CAGGAAECRHAVGGGSGESPDAEGMDCGRSAGEGDDRVPLRGAVGYGTRSQAVSISVSVYRNGPLEPQQEPCPMSGRTLPFIGIPSCVRTFNERDFHTVNERYPNAVIDARGSVPLVIPALGPKIDCGA